MGYKPSDYVTLRSMIDPGQRLFALEKEPSPLRSTLTSELFSMFQQQNPIKDERARLKAFLRLETHFMDALP